MSLPKNFIRLLLLCVAAACFLVTAAGVRLLVDWPAELGLGRRIDVYLEHRERYDAIYLGSSNMIHGLDPTVIDPLVARATGRPFQSFNLAADGAQGLEVDHLIRTLLRDPAERLEWVVIEAPRFSGELGAQVAALTERGVFWHTPRQTRHALADLVTAPVPKAEALGYAASHTRLLAMWLTNTGRGATIWRKLFGDRELFVGYTRRNLLASGGYHSFESRSSTANSLQRARFSRDPRDYTRALEAFASRDRAPGLERYPVEILKQQVAFLEARGLTPIYVMAPAPQSAELFHRLATRGVMKNFFDYAQPDTYPELFALSARWDASHLTAEGAALWSRRVARDLAPLVGGRTPAL